MEKTKIEITQEVLTEWKEIISDMELALNEGTDEVEIFETGNGKCYKHIDTGLMISSADTLLKNTGCKDVHELMEQDSFLDLMNECKRKGDFFTYPIFYIESERRILDINTYQK